MDNNYLESERSYEIDAFKGEILRLMDHNINDIFAEIIRATSDFNHLKSVLSSLNASDSRNDFRILGSTSEEVLRANSVDKKMNYVQFSKAIEARNIIGSWSVNVDIVKEIVLLREIRNRLSHYDELNKYKNIGEVYKDLFILDCFMFSFKIKFPDKYEDFKSKYDEIIQKVRDFAEKYNEKITESLKSNKISVEEYCRELHNDIFCDLSIDVIKEKLYVAIGNLGIDVSGGKFKKEAKMDILKYFYRTKDYETTHHNSEPDRDVEIESLYFRDINESQMRRIIRDYNILVDYRCLSSVKARTFLEQKLIPVLRSSGQGAKLFYVYEGLNYYFKLHKDDRENRIIQFINSNMDMKIYSYIKTGAAGRKEEDQIIELLTNTHYDNAFCILTQSQSLIKHIQEIKRDGVCIINTSNNDIAGESKDVAEGYNYHPEQNDSRRNSSRMETSSASVQRPGRREEFKPLFKLERTCAVDTNTVLNVSHIPSAGDEVYTLKDHRGIKLLDFVNGGGEGSIYTTNEPGIVAKIYFEKCITKNRLDKLTLMTEHQPNIKNVCWPIDIIVNKAGEFVGYTMSQAFGKDMAKTIFKGICRDLNRSQLVECLIKIFKVISELHRNNILLGDINGGNILIKSPEEIYFVDTDSYQIEKYPCPVGTELFTPPEIFKSENGDLRDFGRFLRSAEDERYALGVLAFMTLIPGATPYPMVEGRFQRGFRFPQNGKKAEGKLTYNCIWSHIHFQVKQLFWRVFDDNDRTVTPDKWIYTLNIYKRDIGDDEVKNKIFITTYKDTGEGTFIQKECPLCNMPLNITVDEYNRRSAAGKPVWCKACTLKQNHINNLTTFMTCKMCGRYLCVSKVDYDRQVEKITDVACERCGKVIHVNNSKYEWRREHGWSILCSDCDTKNGLSDAIICCRDCDSKYGVRLKYDIPSLADIINSIE